MKMLRSRSSAKHRRGRRGNLVAPAHTDTHGTMAEEVKKAQRRQTSWQRKTARKRAAAGGSDEPQPTKRRRGGNEEEARLREACASAKVASAEARERRRLFQTAQPGDDALAAAYIQAKAKMRAFNEAKQPPSNTAAEPAPAPSGHRGEAKAKMRASNEAKQQQAPSGPRRGGESAAAASAAAADGEENITLWTCAVCDVTIRVRADGHAREQHLAGKAHARKVRQCELILQ